MDKDLANAISKMEQALSNLDRQVTPGEIERRIRAQRERSEQKSAPAYHDPARIRLQNQTS